MALAQPLTVPDQSSNPIDFLRTLVRNGAPPYETAFGRVHFINEPEHVARVLDDDVLQRTDLVKLVLGRGLLSSDGPYWRKQRKLMQPEFARLKNESFVRLVTESTERLLETWRPLAKEGATLDVAPVMTQLTLEVIVSALFSVELNSQGPELGDAITVLMEGLGEYAGMTFNIPMSFSPQGKREFSAALAEVDAFCKGIIDERRAAMGSGAPVPQDLLALLMSVEGQEQLSDTDLRDEVVTMLISGHETTALILSWSWALLDTNPEVLGRLHEELDQVFRDRTPTLEDIPKLALTRQILMESMRLYPPVWFIARRATRKTEIGPITVLAGENALLCPYLVHRHPDYWESPESFDPERFTPEAIAARPRGVYIPFGGGRHTCLGQHLAMIEGILMLATLAREVRVTLVEPTCPEIQPAITLRQLQGVRATLHPRATIPAVPPS